METNKSREALPLIHQAQIAMSAAAERLGKDDHAAAAWSLRSVKELIDRAIARLASDKP